MRIGDLRDDALHPLTTDLVNRFNVIGIEDSRARDDGKSPLRTV
jgi:hypothetical protein